MSTAAQDAMIWLNATFGAEIQVALKGTPVPKELLIAVGIQETFYIWAKIYKDSTVEKVLSVCVGDTLDYPKRKNAWPKDRAELEAHPQGTKMFKIARDALLQLAKVNAGYKKASLNPDKFCHGFGMFQYDLQFFKQEPDFFLQRKWATWGGTLEKGVGELTSAAYGLYGKDKKSLTHDESVYVGIAYNQGVKKTKSGMGTKKFKMGYKDGELYYGEHIDHSLKAMKGLW